MKNIFSALLAFGLIISTAQGQDCLDASVDVSSVNPENSLLVCGDYEQFTVTIGAVPALFDVTVELALKEGLIYKDNSLAITGPGTVPAYSVTVNSENSVSVVFSESIPAGTTLNMAYEARAFCSVLPEGGSGVGYTPVFAKNNTTVNFRLQSDPAGTVRCSKDNPATFNIDYPYFILDQVLQADVSNSIYSFNGNLSLIQLPLSNTGGIASSFYIKVKHSDRNIIDLEDNAPFSLVNPNGGPDDRIDNAPYQDDGTWYTIPVTEADLVTLFGQAAFDNESELILEQKFTIRGCNLPPLNIEYRAEFGCNDASSAFQICNPGEEFFESNNVVLNIQELVPSPSSSLTYTTTDFVDYCGSSFGEITFTNNSSKDQDIIKNLSPYFQIIDHITLIAISVDGDGDGVFETPLSFTSSSSGIYNIYTVSLAGVTAIDGLVDFDGDQLVNDLPKGEAVKFRIEFTQTCPASPCNFRSNYLYVDFQGVNACGSAHYSASSFSDYLHKYQEFSADAPADVTTEELAEFSLNYSFLLVDGVINSDCADNDYFVEINLPEDFDIGIAADNKSPYYQTSNGTQVTLPDPVLVSPNVYRINFGDDFHQQIGNLVFFAGPSCGSAGSFSNGFRNISLRVLYTCANYTCACEKELGCVGIKTYAHYRCGDTGGDCSILADAFSAERTTLGAPVPSVSPLHRGIWNRSDVSLGQTATGVSAEALKNAYSCDNFKATVSGTISGTNCEALNSSDYSFRVYAAQQYFNAAASAVITINGQNYPVSPSALQSDALGTYYQYPFPAGVTLQPGTVSLTADFILDPAYFSAGITPIPDFRGGIFTANGSSEHWGTRFTVHEPAQSVGTGLISESWQCDNLVIISHHYNTVSDPFPEEVRPVWDLTEYEVEIPQGYTLSATQEPYFRIYAGDLGYSYFEVPFTYSSLPGPEGQTVMTFTELDQEFPVIDQATGSYVVTDLLIPVIPSCGAPNSPGDITSGFNTICGTGSSNSIPAFRYDEPNINLTPGVLQYGISRDVTWTIKVDALNRAQDLWVAVQPDADNVTKFLFQEAYLYDPATGSKTVLPDAVTYRTNSGLSEDDAYFIYLGSVSAGTTRELRIVSRYTNCIDPTREKEILHVYAGSKCGKPVNSQGEIFDASLAGCEVVEQAQLEFTFRNANYLVTFHPVNNEVYDICDDKTFTMVVTSTDIASLYNVTPWMKLPAGISVKSAVVRYDGGQYTLPAPVAVKDGVGWDLWNTVQPFIDDPDQFKGQTASPIEVEVVLTTPPCISEPFDPYNPVEFSVFAVTNCGNEITNLNQQRYIDIIGFTPRDNVALTMTKTDVAAQGDITTVTLTVTNQSSSPQSDVPASRVLAVLLPAQLTYNSGPVPSEQIGNLLVFNMPDLTPAGQTGSSFTLTFTALLNNQPEKCEEFTVRGYTAMRNMVSCNNEPPCRYQVTTAIDTVNYVFPCCEKCICSFAPLGGGEYVLSAWMKEGNNPSAINYDNPEIVITFTGSSAVYSCKPSGQVIDGWQRTEKVFIVPPDATEIHIGLRNNGPSGTSVYFDDIRVHPFNSNMKTYVYHPTNLRFVAELDENNYATFYEYDEEGALIRVKKETEKGIVTVQESRTNTKKTE